MAHSIQSFQEVLAGTDEATAALMLQLTIEDVQSDDANFPYENDFLCARSEWERELKRFRDTRPQNALLVQPPPPPAITFQCAGCEERFGSDDCWDVPCGHHYCDGCLNGLFRVAMTDTQAYPPRCCRLTIPFEDVERHLDKELATQFAAKKPELDDPKPTYCNVPTCSTYISDDQKEANVACCPSCKVKTCLLCKHAGHEGDCEGDKATESTKQLAKTEGWQQCPQCKNIVELTFGCNHMTCTCKSSFCYKCGKTWRTCGCPQYDEPRLFAEAQRVAIRNRRGDVNAIAAGLREHHECVDNNHDYVFTHGENNCEVCRQVMPVFVFRCRRCHIQLCRRCRLNRT